MTMLGKVWMSLVDNMMSTHQQKDSKEGGWKGAIIVKQTKNHIGWLKNYPFFKKNLCNATLMSCWSRKFVLNDLYESWGIFL